MPLVYHPSITRGFFSKDVGKGKGKGKGIGIG